MKRERWAFSDAEFANPHKCKSDDELVAYVDYDDEFEGTDGQQVVVYRDGRVSNRFADGTAGVPEGMAIAAEAEESLLHPDGEDTSVWRDVVVGDSGEFLCFLRQEFDFPESRSRLV